MSDDAVCAVRPHDRVLLIEVQVRTLHERAVGQLVDEVYTAAAERPGATMVLDLSQVKFAPSVALGSLVQLSKSFKLDGRRIALVGVDRRVRDAIRVTRLDKLLDIYHSIDQLEADLPE